MYVVTAYVAVILHLAVVVTLKRYIPHTQAFRVISDTWRCVVGPYNEYKFCLLSQSDLHLVVDNNEEVLRLLPGANGVTGCAYWIGVSGRGWR